jgi:cobalt-zinc-cadmium efflux system outer membrane protein
MGVPRESLPPIGELEPEPPEVDPAPTLEVALARALEQRSELVALRAAEAAAVHRVAAERRGVLSDVVLHAGTKRTAGYSTRVIGVALPLPLLDRNSAGRALASAELQLVRSDLRLAEHTVSSEVSAALESYETLLAARPVGADSLAARASEVARIADAAYAAGGGSLLELLEARRARVETLAALLRWLADVRLARLDLLRAIGASPLDSLNPR